MPGDSYFFLEYIIYLSFLCAVIDIPSYRLRDIFYFIVLQFPAS